MERYSGAPAMEATPADPQAEWREPGGETAAEERVWQLGRGGGPEFYPERPDEPECIYYLRTGFCGYGNRCRFNHPRDRSAAMIALRVTGGEYPERMGEPFCQYYMRTGMCKFGASCKYHHPKHGAGSSSPFTLNIYGYPLREGEKDCLYYIKTGQCKFGVTCKYNHPQPAGMQMPSSGTGPGPLPTPTLYPTMHPPSVQTSQQFLHGNWPVARATMLPGSYVPGSYGPLLLAPGVVPVPGWPPYPAQVSPGGQQSTQQSTQPTVGAGPIYGITRLPPSPTTYEGTYLPSTSLVGPSSSIQKERAFPNRPGQPECQYYLRTGDCKFGATCKYHHPPERSAQKSVILSPMGLPMRPGAPLCSHYAQSGVCRFGPSCKFDHPMRALSYSTSASSLTDMPVAPYPMGSTNATLAPSSSSLGTRPELLLANLSSTNSSSASVGSTFSKSGPIPELGVQHSGQGSASTGGSSSTHGGEVKLQN